jgi:nucleoside-diphosphate-sugar epimerase
MQKSIAIVGCGWLGTPLAERLVARGFTVYGTTTATDKIQLLNSKGIHASILRLGSTNSSNDPMPIADIYIVNIPPSGISDYASVMTEFAKSIPESCKQIIFCSTTSVYPDISSVLTESLIPPDYSIVGRQEDEARHGTKRSELLKAENAFWRLGKTTIMRLAGLFGGDRHPVRFLSGKQNLSSPQSRVNLVHLNDLAACIERVIDLEIRNEIINVCASEHPKRKDYYTAMAEKFEIPTPTFDESDTSTGKIISNEKLIQITGITPSLYAYPLT